MPIDFMAAAGTRLGTDWQRGTRWRPGLTGAEMDAAEVRYGLQFPPDYRLFLATLNTPDRPVIGARYEGGILPRTPRAALVPWVADAHTDWKGNTNTVEPSIAWPLEGLLWSIEANQSWDPSWGLRPASSEKRESVVRRLAHQGPQLVPLGGDCYLAGPGGRSGNPVLSMHGEDVIEYGGDLRSYLLLAHKLVPWSAEIASSDEPIPFWQEVIEGLSWPGIGSRLAEK